MRRGKYTFPAALFLYGILTLNMTNVILNEVKNPRNKGRSGCIVVRTPIFVYALPLQRESILPEGWYFSEFIQKNKKPERKIFLRSGFNHIVNLFVD